MEHLIWLAGLILGMVTAWRVGRIQGEDRGRIAGIKQGKELIIKQGADRGHIELSVDHLLEVDWRWKHKHEKPKD